MVADLEGEGAERGVGGEEALLSRRAEIARQEEREAAPVDPQHQRLLVLADGRGLIERRRTVWAEHRDESRAQPEALARGERPPAGSRALERPQGFLAARAPAPVLPELTDPHALENGAEPARVIRIGMRHGHDVEARRRAVPEIGQEDALAHVETSRAAGAAVDEEPRSFGSFHEDGVALAHVEEGDTQLAIAGPHPLPERKRQDETEEPGRCDAGPAPRAEEGEKGQRRVPARDGDPSGRGQVDERGGEERRRLDGQAQGPEHEPERLEEDVRDQLGHARDEQREHAERGAGGGQGNHDEIGGDACQRELVEVGEHDGRDGELRAQADGHRGGEPVRPPARAEPGAQWHRQPDDAGRGREGELEAGLPEITGSPGQEQEHGQGQRVRQLRLPLEEQREQKHEPHHGGPQHRGLTADDEGEAHEGECGRHRRGTARDPDAGEHEEDEGREKRHVEAGDGQDVIDAGAAKRLIGFGR